MKIRNAAVLALALAGGLSACASGGGLRDAERLELYRANAGEPVGSFSFLGRINGWTPLGDSALAVWTKPSEAFLLELFGPCQDLDFAQAISLTNNMNRVYARFDKVLVHSSNPTSMPCNIQTIRPLDIKTVRASERELREAAVQEREAEGR